MKRAVVMWVMRQSSSRDRVFSTGFFYIIRQVPKVWIGIASHQDGFAD